MGCCLSILLCNATCCLCKGVCSCCVKLIPSNVVAGRVAYVIVFLISVVLSWVLRMFATDILDWVPELDECSGDKCTETFAVYRLSFDLFVFHIILALLLIGVDQKEHEDDEGGDDKSWREHIQESFWLFKVIFLIGFFFACLYIPNAFFSVYGWIALILAAFFILLQIVILIDFIQNLASKWVGNFRETDDRKWHVLLLSVSFFFFAATLALTIASYALFGCTLGVIFPTINICLAILVTILSILPTVQEKNENSGILQASFVSLYCSYLTFTSLASFPDTNCNPFYSVNEGKASNIVVQVLGVFFTIAFVVYSVFRVGWRVSEEGTRDEESENCLTQHYNAGHFNITLFHVAFALGAAYIGMLMSDWSVVTSSMSSNQLTVDTGLPAVWIKITTSWVSYLIYLWTLVAPVIFSNRDWS